MCVVQHTKHVFDVCTPVPGVALFAKHQSEKQRHRRRHIHKLYSNNGAQRTDCRHNNTNTNEQPTTPTTTTATSTTSTTMTTTIYTHDSEKLPPSPPTIALCEYPHDRNPGPTSRSSNDVCVCLDACVGFMLCAMTMVLCVGCVLCGWLDGTVVAGSWC